MEKESVRTVLKRMDSSDIDRIARFLAGVFRTGTDDLFINPDLLRWKYFTPRPDWPGPRSYALVKGEKILSHFGVCPLVFRSPEGEVGSATYLDWASDREYLGAGVRLWHQYKKEYSVKTSIHLGGTEAAMKVVPRLGFAPEGEVLHYVKRIRPWRMFQADTGKNWKSPLRFVRDSMRSAFARPVSRGSWTAERVERFEGSITPVLGWIPGMFSDCKRTADLLNYMLACPAVPFSAYLLRDNGVLRGYFLLGRMGDTVRVVDLFIASGSRNDWSAAYAAATDAAASDQAVHSVFAFATAPFLSDALTGIGYLCYRKDTLAVFDPDGLVKGMYPLNIQMIDCDTAYLPWEGI